MWPNPTTIVAGAGLELISFVFKYSNNYYLYNFCFSK
jgi:hypothetical protein